MKESIERITASLFVTCIVDQFYPEVGESTVNVLRRLGVDVEFLEGQTCCGQLAFNSGFWNDAKPLARRFLEMYRDRPYIVMPSGSCASMVRVFYEDLLHDDPELLSLARKVGPRVFELSEFIVDVLGIKNPFQDAGEGARSPTLKVTYHEACHLRHELGATSQPRALIRSVPNAELVEMDQAEVCCGFGGTFSVKYPEISAAMLQDKIDNIRETGADAVVACDCTCLMHLAGGLDKQGVDVRAIHLAQLLDQAIDRR